MSDDVGTFSFLTPPPDSGMLWVLGADARRNIAMRASAILTVFRRAVRPREGAPDLRGFAVAVSIAPSFDGPTYNVVVVDSEEEATRLQLELVGALADGSLAAGEWVLDSTGLVEVVEEG